MAVQDKCPDTLLANDRPTADNLIVIRLEVVMVAGVRVCDEEKMGMKAVVVDSETGLV